MALEGDDFPQQRTGPKAFTEYSFNAILVMVGMIGSFMSVIGSASFYVFLLPFSSAFGSFFGSGIFVSGIIGLIMIPFGALQLYYAWKIHTENFTDFRTIIYISWTQIVLAIVSALFMGFFIIVSIQLIIGQLLLNIIVIFFLSKDEVQQEFTWKTGEY